MAFWGLLFLAIGVGALLDVSIWPLVFIVLGVAMLLPVLTGSRRARYRYPMWWCWWDPSAWERSRERRSSEQEEGPERPTRV